MDRLKMLGAEQRADYLCSSRHVEQESSFNPDAERDPANGIPK